MQNKITKTQTQYYNDRADFQADVGRTDMLNDKTRPVLLEVDHEIHSLETKPCFKHGS